MNSDLLVTVIRLGYLALLWIFVFVTLGVLRRDVFGTVVTQRGRGRRSVKSSRLNSSGDTPVSRGRRNSQTEPKHLVITGGNLLGTTMPLGAAPIVIGRSPACTLVVDDSYTSAQHARLYNEDGQWWIEDLHSTNGCFVDGERIGAPRPIGPGNQVRIGQTTLEISR